MRVALIGVGYFPRLTAGDKNFFYRLMPALRQRLDEVVVLSVNDEREEVYKQDCGGVSVTVYNFKRSFHTGDMSRFKGEIGELLHYHHRHGAARDLAEKGLTLLANTSRIKGIFARHDIKAAHFLDNFGYGMRYIKRVTGVKTSFAAANYEPRGSLYDTMQASFLHSLDGVVTYSKAYREILVRLGLPESKIDVIHWGVDPARFRPLDPDERAAARARHGIPKGSMFALWSGFIQQIRERDFQLTAEAAGRLAARDAGIEFVFCFKPEVYDDRFNAMERPGVRVIRGSDDFRMLLGCADILLSPVEKLGSTVSPPLTWVEAMAMGVPVLTTSVLGADELITDGVDGYITRDYLTLESALIQIKAAGVGESVKQRAVEKVKALYAQDGIADRYAKFFRKITGNGGTVGR